jgi:hypothetical protein
VSAACPAATRATGTITIDRKSGYRTKVPVSILRVDNRKRFVIAK